MRRPGALDHTFAPEVRKRPESVPWLYRCQSSEGAVALSGCARGASCNGKPFITFEFMEYTVDAVECVIIGPFLGAADISGRGRASAVVPAGDRTPITGGPVLGEGPIKQGYRYG